MGWAAGVERILLSGDAQPAEPAAIDLYVAFEVGAQAGRVAFGLLREARTAGLTAQMELAGRSLKNQLAHARSLGARYVAIVGPGETVLEDVRGGARETLASGAVVPAVRRGLRDR